MQIKKYNRKSYVQVLEKGLKYIELRKAGIIKSLATPWRGLNIAGVGGLEWGSMLTVGARPGSGKTMFVSQLIRDAHRLNPDQKFNVLEFQFEMGDEQYAARQFAAEVAEDYGVVLSTKGSLDEFKLEMMRKYINECKDLQSKGIHRDIVSEALTCAQIEEVVKEAYVEWGSQPMIVTIDHSWLIKKGISEKDKFDVLYNVTEMLMQLKKSIPIIVIMITQLNRSIDDPIRKQSGSVGNYPNSGDIFGGDALMQGSDMVVVLFRPYKADITAYGPKNYRVEPDQVYMHLIKSRNSSDDNAIIFLRMHGRIQSMIECPEFDKGGTFQLRSQRTGARQTAAPIGDEL